MIGVKVAHDGRRLNVDLPPGDVIRSAVHDGPDGLIAEGPAARVYAKVVHGVERLPVGTDEKRRDTTLNGRDATRGFCIAGVDSVPDAPDILPAFPTDAVEEGELQVVSFVGGPAIADVDHMARFKPFVAVDHGDERK